MDNFPAQLFGGRAAARLYCAQKIHAFTYDEPTKMRWIIKQESKFLAPARYVKSSIRPWLLSRITLRLPQIVHGLSTLKTPLNRWKLISTIDLINEKSLHVLRDYFRTIKGSRQISAIADGFAGLKQPALTCKKRLIRLRKPTSLRSACNLYAC